MSSAVRILAILALTAATLTTAFAASVSVGPGSIGTARASSPRCTTAGLSLIQNLSGSTVVSVTVANIPSSCGNGTLQATVNNGATSASGSATIPAAGGLVTVTLVSALAIAVAEETDLVITGP
jgi:hypothetical protein